MWCLALVFLWSWHKNAWQRKPLTSSARKQRKRERDPGLIYSFKEHLPNDLRTSHQPTTPPVSKAITPGAKPLIRGPLGDTYPKLSQVVFFYYAWLISLSIMFSRFIHVVTNAEFWPFLRPYFHYINLYFSLFFKWMDWIP
jgi:hypothetical protein